MATLAAVLFVVAYNMGEWREIPRHPAARLRRQVGLADHLRADGDGRSDDRGRSGHGVRRAALHLSRLGHDHGLARDTRTTSNAAAHHSLQDKHVPAYVSILRIHGPFLFGTTDKLAEETSDLSTVHADRRAAAAQHDGDRCHRACTRWRRLPDRLKKSGRTLLLCGAPHQPSEVPEAGRVRRPHRRREHPAAHQRGAQARRADPSRGSRECQSRIRSPYV